MDHAQDFSERYSEPLDYHAGKTMLDLGIDPQRIGAPDPDNGFKHAAFHPKDSTGGSITPDGRIILDSGVMNLEALDVPYGEEAGKLWAGSRLKDRMQAIIAHEEAEHLTGSHAGALATDTELPVSHRAKEILRAMRDGWKNS